MEREDTDNLYLKPVVVGFLGRMESGKSTAAEHLYNLFNAHRMSLAAPLKMLALRLWDFSYQQVYGSQEEKDTVDHRFGISPRQAMQRLGEGARQVLGEDIWLSRFFDRIYKQEKILRDRFPTVNTSNLYATDDLRYHNECSFLKSQPIIGIIIKLNREGDAGSESELGKHPSESQVDKVPAELIDYTITSHKTPNSLDLKQKLNEVFKSMVRDRNLLLNYQTQNLIQQL